MQFIFKEKHLRRLCEINCFVIPENEMIFFGLRGCTAINENNSFNFAAEHRLDIVEINNETPRCIIGQWKPAENKIACFIGSTVPRMRRIIAYINDRNQGANQLMTGLYTDYTKGTHRAGSPTGHKAFRQTQAQVIRRTLDDTDYDNNDRVEVTNPTDNIHAGWCRSYDSAYDSAGCQVLMGYPTCPRREPYTESGHWKIFRQHAYEGNPNQSKFIYILLNGNDARRISLLQDGEKTSARLRFGSQGDLVKTLQQALKEKEFFDGTVDGKFGRRTLGAVLAFQEMAFGPSADDGIVGPNTAEALGIAWVNL